VAPHTGGYEAPAGEPASCSMRTLVATEPSPSPAYAESATPVTLYRFKYLLYIGLCSEFSVDKP
jgi:hypothetical protein